MLSSIFAEERRARKGRGNESGVGVGIRPAWTGEVARPPTISQAVQI
jgi:hypothetical protein